MSTKSQIVGSVVAGFPSPAEQYVEPPLDLNEFMVKRPVATIYVKVEGDSMIGRGIYDGDLLVVDRSLTPANGDVVVAALDGEFTVKTLRTGMKAGTDGRKHRFVALEPANPNYPTITIRPGQELLMYGKVTGLVRKL